MLLVLLVPMVSPALPVSLVRWAPGAWMAMAVRAVPVARAAMALAAAMAARAVSVALAVPGAAQVMAAQAVLAVAVAWAETG